MSQFLTTEIFISKAKDIHGDKYDYSKVNYISSQTKVTIICPEHGEFSQSPNSHLSGSICNLCFRDNKKFTIEQFVQKAQQVHGYKYNYSKVVYIGYHSKITILCSIHGEFEQTPGNHLQGFGCLHCRYDDKRLTTKEFIQKANKVHGNKYDYSNVVYIGCHDKITIICKKKNHNEFEQTPGSHLNGTGCPVCKASKGELAIKAILDNYNIKHQQQYKIPDEKYLFMYDFYLPDYNLLIEFHGRQHYEHNSHFHKTYNDFEEQRMRDKNKIILAKSKGIPLLEFNYKQLKHLSKEQFEDLIISSINRKTRS